MNLKLGAKENLNSKWMLPDFSLRCTSHEVDLDNVDG